ncbi:MAG: hypothetical protein LAN83_02365 [Acidobacteriia bacterium]|nr:hypothetical protein [Terriglobia bacterium]
MRKLPAVEAARAVMTEAMDWSVWRWLLEKSKVREIADRATAALDRADRKAKAAWSDELKKAYSELANGGAGLKRNGGGRATPEDCDSVRPEIRVTAKRIKQADDRAERVRLDAEDTFDEAEQQMSTSLAREGARKALLTYDLREKAIARSEAASS